MFFSILPVPKSTTTFLFDSYREEEGGDGGEGGEVVGREPESGAEEMRREGGVVEEFSDGFAIEGGFGNFLEDETCAGGFAERDGDEVAWSES